MNVSLCIPAYNEENNIRSLLQAFANQQASSIHIQEIIVVASGCTDRTTKIVQELQKTIPLVQLITQKKRQGKASAINAFLKKASEDICVISSADLLPEPNTIEELCLPLKNETIGMTGGHPLPINKPTRFMGYVVHTLWELHHEIALKNPKCGEIIAFRKVFEHIPPETPVDEASIEAQIQKKGFITAYAPKAIVHNKGPQSVKEFIHQRRRINFGHLWLKKNHHYKISTGKTSVIAPFIFKKFSTHMKHNTWLIGLIFLELWSKFLARIDYHFTKKSYTLWEQIPSTKNLNEL